ncbi:hypothetical protein BJ165DRAFT_1458857 [Panaeolus papilionaceus]|nr:hypothetical protein BJ165DRAFT_1518998 [Panaeolus papilionaceus]KAF9031303.1 hypothetical protein BJ165DRAFT_1518999 [Panaeolus papilionaceus]KAF9050588.1 hypothetical protein BJ165DRAFT_1458857 [Panaeolus papilionaceus]
MYIGMMPPSQKCIPSPYTHLSSNELHDLLMNCAILLYKAEQKQSMCIKYCPPPMGYCTVCDVVQKEFLVETGLSIPISHTMLRNWVAQ